MNEQAGAMPSRADLQQNFNRRMNRVLAVAAAGTIAVFSAIEGPKIFNTATDHTVADELARPLSEIESMVKSGKIDPNSVRTVQLSGADGPYASNMAFALEQKDGNTSMDANTELQQDIEAQVGDEPQLPAKVIVPAADVPSVAIGQ